jgi:hypothetical protein
VKRQKECRICVSLPQLLRQQPLMRRCKNHESVAQVRYLNHRDILTTESMSTCLYSSHFCNGNTKRLFVGQKGKQQQIQSEIPACRVIRGFAARLTMIITHQLRRSSALRLVSHYAKSRAAEENAFASRALPCLPDDDEIFFAILRVPAPPRLATDWP